VSTSATATATTFSFGAPRIVFGAGAASETGAHLRNLGVTRAFVVCDRFLLDAPVGSELLETLRGEGVEVVTHPVAGEPTETSVREAAAQVDGSFDGFVGIGGGSAVDTAKLCALLAAHGGDLLDYVNAPIGGGRPVPGPLPPVVALPTTSGTGAEVTTVAIVDFPHLGTKTGVSHRFLQPSLGIVDPLLTLSCPPGVTAATGLDALMHALEAYTTLPYDRRPYRPPAERPPYQGANPLSDPLCERVFSLVADNLRTAVHDGSDVAARTAMSLAATTAGVAFSVAGVHVPHALAYPIASLGHRWQPPDYGGAAFVPHGYAVAVTAPASFRLVQEAVGERAATAARWLDGGDDRAEALESLMRDVGAPTRLGELGYGEEDLEALVRGALDQQRLLVGAPVTVGATELEAILRESL
jgi:alcohol dehydrogenase class IV